MFYPVSSVDLCLTGKGAKTPLFAVLSSDLKKNYMKKIIIIITIIILIILPYLIDVNWLVGFIFRVKWLERKSQL